MKSLWAFVALSLLISGCEEFESASGRPPEKWNSEKMKVNLASAEAQWARVMSNLDEGETFRYSYSFTCFCRPPSERPHRVVSNKNGDLLETQLFKDGVWVDATDEEMMRFYSVPDLFSHVENHIRAEPDFMHIEWDPVYGLPLKFEVDRNDAIERDELLFQLESITFSQ